MVTSTVATPIELMSAQVDSETLSFPTGAAIFSSGQSANAIYGVRRGIVEVIDGSGAKLCCQTRQSCGVITPQCLTHTHSYFGKI